MKCPQCFKEVPDLNYKCPHCAAVLKEGIEPDQFRAASDRKRTLRVSTLLLVVLMIAGAVFLFISVNQSEEERPPSAVQETGDRLPDPQQVEPVTPPEETGANTDIEEALAAEEASDPAEQEGDPTDAGDPATELEPGEETETEEPTEAPDYEEPVVNYPKPRVTHHNPGEEVGLRDMSYPGRTTIFDFYSDYCGPCLQISPLLEALGRKRDDIAVVKIDINRPGIQGIDWQSPVAAQYGLRSIPYFIIYSSQRRESHSGDAARQRVFELLQEENIR